jgi:DNA (cytosine-5)-methyltransferase 1
MYSLTARDQYAVCFTQNSRDEVRQLGGDGQIAGALAAEPGMKQTNYVCFQPRIGRNGRGYGDNVVPALNGADAGATSDMRPCVAFADCFNGRLTGDVAATMGTRGSSETASGPTLMHSSAVRRLTPRECERLQGFPDDYTLVPYRGKPAADGPRYKALGNSMAVPVMRWIGERIALVDAIGQQRAAA